jgi:hypothetical protein
MTFASTNSWGMPAKKLPEATAPFLKACNKLPPRGKLEMAKMLGPPKQMSPDRADEGILFTSLDWNEIHYYASENTLTLHHFLSFLPSFCLFFICVSSRLFY